MQVDPIVITLVGVAIVEGGGALFWAGSTHSRLKALEVSIKPIVSLQTEMATLKGRIDMLLQRLPDGPGGRRARHAPAIDED